jgi:hypothetical protein
MTRFRRIKPSPSMVVAALALLVALGGTGVAAVAVAVPRNSVGTLQLKNNSVVSSKVRNGSLLRADFRAGQIPRARPGPPGPRGGQGPAGATGPTGATGPAGANGVVTPGYVAGIVSKTSTSSDETSSTSFSALADGSLTVSVPSGETDSLVVFFSGESACYGGSSLQRCALRIKVDDNELSPSAGSDAYFDNNDLGKSGDPDIFQAKTSNDQESHAIVRVSGNLGAGSHTVKVEYQTTSSSTTFRLDDWALVAQRVKVS